ncbi:MAG: cytidylate kinase family protein, partial [Peptococcaceae bacterium]|nr:cytidylate kinase family protein [Peptococcaceae bacterium]
IKALAAKSNCVIVGRNADIILRDQNPLRIFVHADIEARIARCRRRDTDDANLTDKQFEKKINQIDKNRSKTHSILSPYKWGDRRGYELCINTTAITIKDVVSSLSAYAEKWFEIERH